MAEFVCGRCKQVDFEAALLKESKAILSGGWQLYDFGAEIYHLNKPDLVNGGYVLAQEIILAKIIEVDGKKMVRSYAITIPAEDFIGKSFDEKLSVFLNATQKAFEDVQRQE